MRVAPRFIARPVAILSGLAVLVATANSPAQERGESRPASRLERPMIPDPPRQKDPWQPPATTLPAFLVKAAAALFEQGLADPRGCDYRAIEIVIGSVWSGDGDVTRTRGWVLPPADGARPRFAVAWNGLVYPTVSIGEPADLEAEVRALVQQARPGRPGEPGRRSNGFRRDDEASAVSPESLHPVKVCLLLRLGRADLAEVVWAAGAGRPRDVGDRTGRARREPIDEGISYVTLANDLAWYLLDRAVRAHVRSDDALALADARKLTAFQKAVEARAEAMGLAHPPSPDGRGQGPAPYVGFLGQLPDLLADQERRAREPRRAPAPPPPADRKARIAALIADLDQVAAPSDDLSGLVSLDESPIIKALVEAGDDAVDPLIEYLERDARLTRTVYPRRDSFGRDSGRSLTVMTAHEAAVSVVSRIVKEPFSPATATGENPSERGREGRQAAADRIRAFWEKNRGVPIVDRWYRTLADDRAEPWQWLQAAWYIVYRDGAEGLPGIPIFPEAIETSLPPGARPRLRGEALRAKRAPTVAELMARRAKDLDPGGPLAGNASDRTRLESANQMAAMLAEWDGRAALPVLKARVDRSVWAARATQQAGERIYGLEAAIASLTELRVRAGDPQALDDYAVWIRTLTTRGFPYFRLEIFESLWSHPDHPAVAAAAAAMFEDPRSPWYPLTLPRDIEADRIRVDLLLASPLLGLTSFRTLVLRALADRTRLGTVETDAEGRVVEIEGNYKTVRDANSTSVEVDLPGEPSTRRESPFKPGPKAKPLRVADEACERLQILMGIPHFRKEWPLARRDEAIAACAAYLKRYGDRFRENEAARAIGAADPAARMFEKALLAFDPLDHPATAEEVAAGRAIFSLVGDGAEVRHVPLPSFPIAARWTKLAVFPDEPPIMTVSDGRGHSVPYIEGLQTGRVWQAEEVRQGDGWRRYYGFVGRHALTRVPAEDIEFVPPPGWAPLSADLDGRIVVKEAATDGPIPIELLLRNHHGVETAAPSDLVRETGGGFTIREGIAFRLTRVSERPELLLFAMGGAREKPFPPEVIAVRPVLRHPAGAPPRALAPAAAAVALRLDLRTLFPIDRPGRYRLEITFDDLKTRGGKPGTVEADFPVVARKTE
jgi:hypothetical protein